MKLEWGIQEWLKGEGYRGLRTHYPDIYILTTKDEGYPTFLAAFRYKRVASYHRKTGRMEFGVDAPDVERYMTISDFYPGLELLVFFYERETGKVGFYPLQRVRDERYYHGERFPDGIYFVPVDSLMTNLGLYALKKKRGS
jgi:hypothetical protein